jgi:formylglycine-generating enzyme required for sulfatase activity
MRLTKSGRVAAMGVAIGVTILGQAWGAQAGKSPVKVFILAGQSNMEGQGAIGGGKGTLEFLVKEPASAPRYKHLIDKDGKWVVRDDVWCSYGNKGKLTVGGFAADGCIGPELGLGWVLGDYLDNQVLLLKIAVGGTSLAGPWRPPSSGGETGWLYKTVLDTVKNLPTTLKTDFPDYDGKGYEIAGFGWHQGWNDGCAAATAMEYEANMVNFIKDVRKDLGLPNLPFVIGGSGFGGWEQKNARRLMISAAQKAAAEREEFKGNVLYVETRPFFRPREVSPHGFGYHWNGNAETYYLIGEGMGKAMVELLGGPKAPANATNPLPPKVKKDSGPKAALAVVKLPELTLDLGNTVTMKLLKIPAGKFMMGSPDDEEGRGGNEGPRHEVTISKPFYMGLYEVTVEQFDQFVKDSGYAWEKRKFGYVQRNDHPASCVNWDDAQVFCKWLSKKTGRTVSLPTEAQWEYACRAGTTTQYNFGDDADDLSEYAHFDMDGWDGSAKGSPTVAPVGSFKPNAWGLYDMHGNVNECCEDYISSAYSPDDKLDPKGSNMVNKRVMRGGSWSRGAADCRSAARGMVRPGIAGPREGLRVVVE